MTEQTKDPKIERAEDAYEDELGSADATQTAPALPPTPVPNPVEDEETGVAP